MDDVGDTVPFELPAETITVQSSRANCATSEGHKLAKWYCMTCAEATCNQCAVTGKHAEHSNKVAIEEAQRLMFHETLKCLDRLDELNARPVLSAFFDAGSASQQMRSTSLLGVKQKMEEYFDRVLAEVAEQRDRLRQEWQVMYDEASAKANVDDETIVAQLFGEERNEYLEQNENKIADIYRACKAVSIRIDSGEYKAPPRQALHDFEAPELDSLIRQSCFKQMPPIAQGILTKRHALIGHEDKVFCMVIHNDRLFSGSYDGSVREWTKDGDCVKTWGAHNTFIFGITTFKEQIVTGGYDGAVHFWKATADETAPNPNSFINAKHWVSKLLPWNDNLISGGVNGEMIIYRGGKYNYFSTKRVQAHSKQLQTLLVYKSRLYSGGWDGKICVWDEKGNKRAEVNVGSDVRVLVDGNDRIYAGCTDGKVRVINPTTLTVVSDIVVSAKDAIHALCWWQDLLFCGTWKGHCIALTADGDIKARWEELHSGVITSMTVWDDCLVTSSYDKTLCVWEWR